jgi:D-serine deaminase-like pyridoxal phosphate-dependent protein
MCPNSLYKVDDESSVLSPGLLFFKDLIRRNIARAIELAGSPDRLRPHVKTHKTREIVQLQRAAGITKHKCATIAEAEMLAGCGAADVLLAYPLVGPNCARMARLVRAFPECRFAVVADHPRACRALSDAMTAENAHIEVLLDVDTGQHRTGVLPGEGCLELYELFGRLPGLRPGGLHVYDGHVHQTQLADREAAVGEFLEAVVRLREMLSAKRLPVPRVVLGGTPTFPVHARLKLPEAEYSPGTCFLHDHGYATAFPDVGGFTPAALMLTRVVSRPTPTRITLDLGTKAIASDPPAGSRFALIDVPEYRTVLHNEEHAVIETPAADAFEPGDVIYAIPTHICPTCALHRSAYVVEEGRVTDRWQIVARDRVLTI